MTFDFYTADNAEHPHVGVYIENDNAGHAVDCVIATFPIIDGDVNKAEAFAAIFLSAMRSH